MPPKIILTRPLPAEHGLEGGAILDRAEQERLVDVVRWTKDEPVDRDWLLKELRKGGTEGLLCMHNGEKVRRMIRLLQARLGSSRGLALSRSFADRPRTECGRDTDEVSLTPD